MSPRGKPEALSRIAGISRDLPHPPGTGVVPADAVHAATLAALSDRFSVVIQDTDALVEKVAV